MNRGAEGDGRGTLDRWENRAQPLGLLDQRQRARRTQASTTMARPSTDQLGHRDTEHSNTRTMREHERTANAPPTHRRQLDDERRQRTDRAGPTAGPPPASHPPSPTPWG